MIIQILFIVIGAYFLIVNGLLGLGMTRGKPKKVPSKISMLPVRIF